MIKVSDVIGYFVSLSSKLVVTLTIALLCEEDKHFSREQSFLIQVIKTKVNIIMSVKRNGKKYDSSTSKSLFK